MIFLGVDELVDQLGCREKESGIAFLASFIGNCCGKMGLAGSCLADEANIGFGIDKMSIGQVQNKGFVQRWDLGKIKFSQGLDNREFGS